MGGETKEPFARMAGEGLLCRFRRVAGCYMPTADCYLREGVADGTGLAQVVGTALGLAVPPPDGTAQTVGTGSGAALTRTDGTADGAASHVGGTGAGVRVPTLDGTGDGTVALADGTGDGVAERADGTGAAVGLEVVLATGAAPPLPDPAATAMPLAIPIRTPAQTIAAAILRFFISAAPSSSCSCSYSGRRGVRERRRRGCMRTFPAGDATCGAANPYGT